MTNVTEGPAEATSGGAAAARLTAAELFAGPGEMRACCRALDWAATPLGPVAGWTPALQAAVRLCLDSGLATAVYAGPELVLVYNDPYRDSLGAGRHPWALGRPAREAWAEAWPLVGPELDRVRAGGPAVRRESQRFELERDGRREEAYFTSAYSPVRDERGAVVAVHAVVVDTTAYVAAERQREAARAALETERARLSVVFQQAPAFLAVYRGPDHVFDRVNDAYYQLIGHGRDIIGKPLLEALPEVRGQGFDVLLDRVLATGEPFVGREVPVRLERTPGAPGEERFVDLTYLPLTEADGTRVGVIAHGTDVTAHVEARREVERVLAESEVARADAEAARSRSEAVLASIADAFYLLDHDWRFTYVNDAAEPLLQTTREALLGRTLWEAFPGVTGSVFEGPYREAMATGQVTSAEAYFEPLGTWFDVRTYPWSGGLMVHFRDVGARKAAEAERERLVRALEIERARLQEVFQRSPSFIVAFRGPDQVYEFVNDAYYQLVGHRAIVGKPLLEAVPEVSTQGYKDLLDGVLATGEPWVGREAPVALQRKPGEPLETRYLDLVFQAFTEADGSRTGVIVHGSDVTEQVLARREVERLLGESERARADAEAARRDAEEARAEAEQANRAKSEFLAVMSHELRTPLNAIGGYTELLEMGIRGPVTNQQRQDFTRIQASQRHLLGLINEVLNYAKLETGAVRYDLEDVPLRAALAAAESLVLPQARARSLTLTTREVPADLAARADAEKLRQILVNLLSNAIKFTEAGDGKPGRIELACEPGSEHVRVSVSDTGIGIPADKLEAIFDPFVQVRGDLTRTAEGTGLGLAISRDLARGMGGDIRVESEVGKGSVFTLELPRARTD